MAEEFKSPDVFQEIKSKYAGTLGGTEIPAFYEKYYGIPTRGSFQIIGIESNLQLTIQLLYEVQALSAEVKSLREELANRPLVSSIIINNLSNENLTVVNPIPVIVEETDDECLARWSEVNAFGIGTTLSEAIRNLKDNISDLFLDLTGRDRESLGQIALETLEILTSYIQSGK